MKDKWVLKIGFPQRSKQASEHYYGAPSVLAMSAFPIHYGVKPRKHRVHPVQF